MRRALSILVPAFALASHFGWVNEGQSANSSVAMSLVGCCECTYDAEERLCADDSCPWTWPDKPPCYVCDPGPGHQFKPEVRCKTVDPPGPLLVCTEYVSDAEGCGDEMLGECRIGHCGGDLQPTGRKCAEHGVTFEECP